MPRKSKKKSSARRNPFLVFCKRLFVTGVILAIIGAFAFFTFYFIRARQFDMEQVAIMPERTVVLDRDGNEIGKMHGANRQVVPLEEISPNFLMSIIAREDARFYEHGGVDYKGLARATVRNVKDKRMTQGASTITMQLARNTFELSQGKKWYHELDRKFLEIFVTVRIENTYEKTEILEHYCNRIFWGHSMLGIEAASQAYLQKPAKNLSLSEGAMLAGIVRGPNAFSPFRSIKLATRERDTVLNRLVYYSYITPKQAEEAKSEPLRIRPKKSRTRGQSYAMEAISRELSYHLAKNNIRIGGLTVHTTIDKSLQEIAEKSVNSRLYSIEKLSGYRHQTKAQFQQSTSGKAPEYLQGALVCIDNQTGGVVVSVGGRSADDSRFNRAYYARRQVGSLFKPFVFQAAYDRGLRPETRIDDGPLRKGEIDYATDQWNPGNSDGKNLGLVPSRDALLRSRNTSSIRVGDYATLPYVVKAAELAGFELFQWKQQHLGKTPNSATAYLGAWEGSPYEVARAYSIFPNLGLYREPYVISKIVDRDGGVLYQRNAGVEIAEKPLTKGATYEVSKILQQINVNGTGATLRSVHGFTAPSGGKTGTTDDYKDAWYAGYTSELTCAVWVGLDTPKRTVSKGYGSRLALPIWADLMKAAAKKPEFTPRSLQANLPSSKIYLCNRSARRANNNCRNHRCAYEDYVPNDLIHLVNRPCTIHLDSGHVAGKTRPPEPSQSVGDAIGGLFSRIFGGNKNRENRAIVVDEDPTHQSYPAARAIVVEEQAPPITQPQRAILVQPPQHVQPATSPPPPAAVKAPQRAIVVEEAPPVTQPSAPPAPARAIVVEEPAHPPRAIIVD